MQLGKKAMQRALVFAVAGASAQVLAAQAVPVPEYLHRPSDGTNPMKVGQVVAVPV